jgi:hypothetical protein
MVPAAGVQPTVCLLVHDAFGVKGMVLSLSGVIADNTALTERHQQQCKSPDAAERLPIRCSSAEDDQGPLCHAPAVRFVSSLVSTVPVLFSIRNDSEAPACRLSESNGVADS